MNNQIIIFNIEVQRYDFNFFYIYIYVYIYLVWSLRGQKEYQKFSGMNNP